jgi:hypothetical protein
MSSGQVSRARMLDAFRQKRDDWHGIAPFQPALQLDVKARSFSPKSLRLNEFDARPTLNWSPHESSRISPSRGDIIVETGPTATRPRRASPGADQTHTRGADSRVHIPPSTESNSGSGMRGVHSYHGKG